MYAYLTGPRFKHRVECIAKKLTELRNDLETEPKWINKQWAKRDRELLTILEATSDMHGDLQGIAGQSLEKATPFQDPCNLGLRESDELAYGFSWHGASRPERLSIRL